MTAEHSIMRFIRYGPTDDHEGDLYLPATPRPPVVCLLHGGFWRMPYGRDQMNEIASALQSGGFAVWNLEYRRLGVPGAGWPGTMDDVAAGVAHLARLAAGGVDLGLDRVAVVGHSAGGHLALWAAGQSRARQSHAVRIAAAVGLAPIPDLARAFELRVGGDVVAELIGGSPAGYPERYRAASPMEMLPLGVRQVILHGAADEAVPIESSRRYVYAAQAAGDAVELIEPADTGHMEFLDPGSEAFAALRRALDSLLPR